MVAAVTGMVALLEPHLPMLSLLVLYLLAILPVAVRWGAGPAAVVSVLSTVVFGYLCGGRQILPGQLPAPTAALLCTPFRASGRVLPG